MERELPGDFLPDALAHFSQKSRLTRTFEGKRLGAPTRPEREDSSSPRGYGAENLSSNRIAERGQLTSFASLRICEAMRQGVAKKPSIFRGGFSFNFSPARINS